MNSYILITKKQLNIIALLIAGLLTVYYFFIRRRKTTKKKIAPTKNTQYITMGEVGAIGKFSYPAGTPVFIFDIDDTLYSFEETVGLKYMSNLHKYAQSLGLSAEESIIKCTEYRIEYGLSMLGLNKHHGGCSSTYTSAVDIPAFVGFSHKINHDLIALLKSIPYPIWCLTNGYLENIKLALKECNLEDCIDGVIYSDFHADDVVCKPSPNAFKFVDLLLGIKKNVVYFFDDFTKNVDAADAHGWNGVHVKYATICECIRNVVSKINSTGIVTRAGVTKIDAVLMPKGVDKVMK